MAVDLPPDMYPRLHNMMSRGGMMGALAAMMMQRMEARRAAAGMSPEDWQTQINSHFGTVAPAQSIPETSALAPVPAGFTGLGSTPAVAQPMVKSKVPVMRPMPQFALNGSAATPGQDPVLTGDWLHHFVSMLGGNPRSDMGGALASQSFGGF